MSLRYAVQSITWGRAPLDSMLREIKEAGYEGVELFQSPKSLGGTANIVDAFDHYALQLVGVASGSFADRCQLVREWATNRNLPLGHLSVPYVYVDEWRDSDERFEKALNEGFRIGLHPHMYKPVQTVKEAKAILDDPKHRQLGFIPDTAHLQIAGDDVAAAIRELSSRLTSIHLKDWKEDVGRSFQFYARGFCELGNGDVDLVPVLSEILKCRFSGWLVIEQDSSPEPCASTSRSLQWLKKMLSTLSSGAPR